MRESFNYWAILVSAVASYFLGFIWFTVLFPKPYLKDLGKTPEEMQQGATFLQASTFQILGNLALAFVMAWLIQKLGYTTLAQTLQLCILVWLGFVVAITGPMYAFQAFPPRFFLIVSVGTLLYILASGIILTLWK